ncbi:MAG: hypothetical protein R2686_07005 [Candidatus Nanopelagicales bacterium]
MTGILIVDIVLVLAVIILTPLALATLLVGAAALIATHTETRSKRRMRRTLDDLIRERR